MKDFSYLILTGKSAFHPEETDLRNRVFRAWFELWDQTYKAAGSDYTLTSDEFVRQNLVTVILDRDKIAALHLYSFFDLQSQSDLQTKYFHFFTDSYLSQLREKNVRSVMSMEFLSVMPEYRKSRIGLSLGSVIIQLGSYVFAEAQADAIVAPARLDLGVDRMAHDIGFVSLEKNTHQRGFQCDLIACFQGQQKPSENFMVHRMAQNLWKTRTVLSSAEILLQATRPSLPKTIKAA
jgi:hypothetical protein